MDLREEICEPGHYHKNKAPLSYTSEMQFLEHFSQQSI